MTLYIAYPDIPWRAQKTTLSAGTDVDAQPFRNTIYGERYQRHKATSDGSGLIRHDYDLGSGVTSAASYFIIARCDLLRSAATGATLYYSSDAISYTQAQGLTLASQTLYGPRSEDLLNDTFSTSAYRYWRFRTSGSAAVSRQVSKVYFGVAFHMGEEPEFSWELNHVDSEFYGESGERDLFRLDFPRYTFTFTWESVTDAKVKEFYNTIVRYSHRHRYFLYTTDQHQVLNNVRILHCRLVSASTDNPSKKVDWNTVTATFEEVLG